MLIDLVEEFEEVCRFFEGYSKDQKLAFVGKVDRRLDQERLIARKTDATFARVVFSDRIVVNLPLFETGLVHSADLLTVDDFLAFGFYDRMFKSGLCFVDVGANIGLHTVVAAKIGYKTFSFEPDESTFELLNANLIGNSISPSIGSNNGMSFLTDSNETVSHVYNAAVADFNGFSTFIKLEDNFFGNHLKGFKDAPYGEMTESQTPVISAAAFAALPGIIKIDAEGADAVILGVLITSGLNIERTKVLLCDWRPETRESISFLISDNCLTGELGRTGSIDLGMSSLPLNRDSDFVVLGGVQDKPR